jgi:hypothetical protein
VRLVWSTDIQLNFLAAPERARFADHLASAPG